jgi:hypothetical protein
MTFSVLGFATAANRRIIHWRAKSFLGPYPVAFNPRLGEGADARVDRETLEEADSERPSEFELANSWWAENEDNEESDVWRRGFRAVNLSLRLGFHSKIERNQIRFRR